MDDVTQWLWDECQSPDWSEGGHVHNWRKYVGGRVKEMWDTFTPEQKYAIAESADWQASREDWE